MASRPSRTLQLTYLGDASNLSKTTKRVGDDLGGLSGKVKNVGKKLAAGFAVVGAAGFTMARDLFEAFEEVSTANARIENLVGQLGNFEGKVGEVSDRLIDQAEATAKLTGVDRNLIKESQGLLLTFDNVNKTAGTVGGVFDRATQAAVDLSAAGFGSVDSAANQLGKALEDPVRGLGSLREVGVSFTAEQEELIKSLAESNDVLGAQDLLLKAVEGQVGGTAEATANGSDRIRQSFGLLKERIAEELGPEFEKLVDKALEWVDNFGAWWDENGDDLIQDFKDFAASAKDVYTNIKEFVDLVVVEVRKNGTFSRLKERLDELAEAGGLAARNTFALFGIARDEQAEASANLFAKLIDIQYKPLEDFVELLQTALDLYNRVSTFFLGRGNLNVQGGTFDPGPDFEPGKIDPDTVFTPSRSLGPGDRGESNITINIEGATDPEGTARTIERTLERSRRRVGTVTGRLGGTSL